MEMKSPSARYLSSHELQLTPLGPLPADWSVTTVGNEFHVQLGKMLDSEKNMGTPKSFLGNRAVQWGRIDVSDIGEIRMSPSDLQRYRLQCGDLLVCEGGEVGRAAIWRDQLEECYYQKALHRLRAKGSYSHEFMAAVLQQYARSGKIQDYVTRTSIAHLPKEKFVSLPIPKPATENEQCRISKALSDADAFIDLLEQLLTKKRQIKQGAMQELLTGKRRLPGFGSAAVAPGEALPRDWVNASIGEIAEVKTGPFGSALHERDYVRSGTPIITVEHLAERGIQGDGAPQVSEKDVTRLQAYRLEEGDIVFSRVGSIDRNARVSADEEGWLFSGRLLRLRLKTTNIDSRFLSYLFHGEPFRRQVESVAVGQTMASLNTKLLSGLEVVVPKVDEQQAIANTLSAIDAEIESLESRLTKARALKQAMAQALLTGRIRLMELNA